MEHAYKHLLLSILSEKYMRSLTFVEATLVHFLFIVLAVKKELKLIIEVDPVYFIVAWAVLALYLLLYLIEIKKYKCFRDLVKIEKDIISYANKKHIPFGDLPFMEMVKMENEVEKTVSSYPNLSLVELNKHIEDCKIYYTQVLERLRENKYGIAKRVSSGE